MTLASLVERGEVVPDPLVHLGVRRDDLFAADEAIERLG